MARWTLSLPLITEDPMQAIRRLIEEQNLIFAELEQLELQVKGQAGYTAQMNSTLEMNGHHVCGAARSLHESDYITRGEAREFSLYARQGKHVARLPVSAMHGMIVPVALAQNEAVALSQLEDAINNAAPADAEYLIAVADARLASARIPTNTPTITWDFATAGQAKANIATTQGAEVTRSSATQTIANNTITAITFDTEVRDDNGFWEGVTNPTRLTVPAAGWYLVTGGAEFVSNATGVRYIDFRKNGSSAQGGMHTLPATGGSVHSLNTATVFYLAASDYVEMRVYQNSGGNLDLGSSSGVYARAKIVRWF